MEQQQLVPSSNRYCPRCMIDKRIRVYWELDNRWYWGVVQDYNEKNGEHLIKYPDCGQGADTEWLKIDVAATMGAPKAVPDTAAALAAIQAEDGGPTVESMVVSSPNRKVSSKQPQTTSASTPASQNPKQKSKSNQNDVKTPISKQQAPTPTHHPAAAAAAGGVNAFHPMQMAGYYPAPHHVNAFPFSPAAAHHMHMNMMSPYGAAAAQFVGSGHHHPRHNHNQQQHDHSTWGAADVQGHASSNATGNIRSSFEDEVKEVASMSKQRPKAGPRTWTSDEDMILLELIKSQGDPIKWSKIADSMSERTGKQCRERYVNHLNPNLKNSDWSPPEDATIFHLFNSMGSQWAKMSKMIPGRTDNGIKNRYHNLKRQLERDDEQRKKSFQLKDYENEVHVDRIRPELPSNLRGNLSGGAAASKVWDMHKGIHLIAANTVKGNSHLNNKVSKQFDSFRKADKDGERCARCGLFAPSVQCGRQICNRTGWCETCTRIPPSICSNLLRECLSLRKEQDSDLCRIIGQFEDRRGKDVES